MSTKNESVPYLSVVVPLFNEEAGVRPLYRAITDALVDVSSYEIIFVDDGSRDGTFEIARNLAAADPRLRVIRFRRNFGQTPAMSAGVDYARGAVIVTMDGDLQNDPNDIPMLLGHVEEGYNLVVGWRYDRKDRLLSRKIPSVIANWLIGKVTGVPIKDNGCSLKAYSKSLIKGVPLYSEMHRFIPAMVSLAGSRLKEVKVQHHARQFGTSKYGLSRTFRVLSDLLAIKTIISFAGNPLRWFVVLAAPLILSSLILCAIGLGRMMAAEAQGYLVLTGIGLLVGASALFLVLCGLVSELVYRTADFRIEDLWSLTARSMGREPAHD